MKKNALLVALLIYGIFSIATFYSWYAKGINAVTGDEPHYIVMSSGLVKQGSLEQTAPYREEFKGREIYKHGLAPVDAQPSPENTHAVLGPNGLFNVHNIGLPILLALPFLFGGVAGAKLTMIFFGSLIIVIAWKFSYLFSDKKTFRFWAVIATTISLPIIPASNQIYPDVVAGLIALTGLYWFYTLHERRTVGVEALLTVMIVFLPWLQIKFAATCVVLVLSISLRVYFQSKDIGRIFRIFIISGVSCLALIAYNYYAFGKISGPYQSGALELSKTSLMVLLGLHIDQNQGFILQNPVYLVGILAIGWMYKINRTFALVWSLVFLSLIVPNALHPAWYGGWSFSGRFQWAAAIVFIAPTIFGLLFVASSKENIFKVIVIGGSILQLYFFYQYAIVGVNLFNKGAGSWFNAYSTFYYPLHGWLPMLYNSDWAYEFLPNYFWVLLIFVLLFFGFLGERFLFGKIRLNKNFIIVFIFILICFSGFSNNQEKNAFVFKASQLPSDTGSVVNSNRLAKPIIDQPGFVNYGPYFSLRKGSYEVEYTYRSMTESPDIVGWIDVFDATSGSQLVKIPLNGTVGAILKKKIDFTLNHWEARNYEFRTYWDGMSEIEVKDISLRLN